MSAHALLAPSSAPQWGYCSGSVVAQQSAPNHDTQANLEGTAAHWVGSDCLENWQKPNTYELLCADWLGKVAPNGVVIDDKMVEGAQVYVDDVLKVAQQYGALGDIMVERRVNMPHIHPQNWGTLDAGLVLPAHKLVYLWDYKHGHREVTARGNLQMVDYLAGIVRELGDMNPDEWRFVIRVVQPYCYGAAGPISEWTGTLYDLMPYVRQLTVQAKEALSNPTMTPGKHCRDCKAVGKCAAARRVAYDLTDYVKEPYEIDRMTGKDLTVERSILLEAQALLKGRLSAIEDDLAHRIKSGEADTGLTVQSTFGRLKWTADPKQVIALAANFGVDVNKPDVLTPTQATAKVPAEMREAFKATIKTITTRPAGQLKLVEAEDSLTSRAFSKTE